MKIEIKKLLRIFYKPLKNSPLIRAVLKRTQSKKMLLKRYHNEALILAGEHKNLNTHQSIMFFTLHKMRFGVCWEYFKKVSY